jgi:hypothetical protein
LTFWTRFRSLLARPLPTFFVNPNQSRKSQSNTEMTQITAKNRNHANPGQNRNHANHSRKQQSHKWQPKTEIG